MPYQYKREPLTTEEVNRLVSACQTEQERLIVLFLLETGLRVAEFCDLTPDDFDRYNLRITVYGKGGPYGKRSKRRIVPLSPTAFSLLEDRFSGQKRMGIIPRTAQRVLKRLAERAGISRPVSPHVLRHTFSVTAVRRGIGLPALQRLLGHSNLATTQIYLNLSPEDVVREFNEKWK